MAMNGEALRRLQRFAEAARSSHFQKLGVNVTQDQDNTVVRVEWFLADEFPFEGSHGESEWFDVHYQNPYGPREAVGELVSKHAPAGGGLRVDWGNKHVTVRLDSSEPG